MEINNIHSANDDSQTHCTETNGDNAIYYGVHIPSDIQVQETDSYNNVYQDKVEALKLVKKYKKARFKAFNFYHEAVKFAIHGYEHPNNNCVDKSVMLTPEGPMSPKEIQPVVGEKPPPFRGPKSQDLVKLRKAIEAGYLDVVQTTIWENPRYLISSGDTPSILQEGFRYNALHVGAKAKNRDMCELILNTISNVNFIKLLYGDDNHQDSEERASILLDLYLNTPDKGMHETPLHFAVKFGAVEVVDLLVSFPQCDKTLRNKIGKTASMIICQRCESSSAVVRNRMAMLLDETFYIPVLRAEDNCIPPVIGEPFAPASPPNINTNLLNPRMEIHAYAGPMNKEGANKFRKLWKTPPRSLKLASCSQNSNETVSNIKFKDLDKGLERIGRDLATQFEVGWKEYWPFLSSFMDLATSEGLQALENYLGERFNSEISTNSSLKYTSSSDSDLNSNSPKLQSKDNSQDISPMTKLCKDLEACTLSDSPIRKMNSKKPNTNISFTTVSENTPDLLTEAQLFKPDLNPFLCIEKSLQVFAHRISNDILHLLESEYNVTTVMLEVQIKQLELLMTSFMDDSRFISVDFHLVHCRLGGLINNKLREVLILEDEYKFMKTTLEHWLENYTKQFDFFSSDDESVNYRQSTQVRKKPTSKNKQVLCLLECILNNLISETQVEHLSNITTEEDCIKAWGEAKPCACIWQIHKIRKGSINKKTNSFKYSSRGLAGSLRTDFEGVNRQLAFGEDSVPNKINDNCDILCANKNMDTNCSRESSPVADVDEKYYTPPNSPSLLYSSSDDESFEDSFLPTHEVYIEGCIPTKMDYAVFNALKCAKDKLNPDDYPYIYQWNHAISLYPESERKSWTSPSIGRYTIGSPCSSSTPSRYGGSTNRLDSPIHYTPPNSWLRITGVNSPRNSLKLAKNNSFY